MKRNAKEYPCDKQGKIAVVLAYRPDLAEIRTIPLEVSERGETLVSEKGIPIPTAVGWKNVQEFYQLVTDRLTMP